MDAELMSRRFGLLAALTLGCLAALGGAVHRADAQGGIAPSQFPLNVKLPADFVDAPVLAAGAEKRLVCDPADAELLRDQLNGRRGEVASVGRGCFAIGRDAATSFNTATGQFSVEAQIESLRKTPISSKGSSTAPSLELAITAVDKREIRGLPVLTMIQDIAGEGGRAKVYFLYVADRSGVWLVRYQAGKRDDLGVETWKAFVQALQSTQPR